MPPSRVRPFSSVRLLAVGLVISAILAGCGTSGSGIGLATPQLGRPLIGDPGPVVAPGNGGDPGNAIDPGSGVEPGQVGRDGWRAPVRYTRASFIDPAAENAEAIVLLLPDGWQANGGVEWQHQWSILAQLHTQVFDPSTGVTIEWLPVQNFIWFQSLPGLEAPIGGNYQGKAYVPPITDPVQFVNQFWMGSTLARLQNAQLVSVDQVPAVAAEFQRQFGGPGNAVAFRMRYEYDEGGQRWEEDVSFALLFTGEQPTLWYVNFAYSVRAPKGEIDRNIGTISTVVASRSTTPQWEGTYRLVQQLFLQGLRQQLADTAAFGRALAQYRAESQALQQQVVQERQASQDRVAELRQEILAGVDTYVDPVNQGYVQLPTGWNKYWVNERGEYLAVDDPGFDPNTLRNGFWQQLQLRQR